VGIENVLFAAVSVFNCPSGACGITASRSASPIICGIFFGRFVHVGDLLCVQFDDAQHAVAVLTGPRQFINYIRPGRWLERGAIGADVRRKAIGWQFRHYANNRLCCGHRLFPRHLKTFFMFQTKSTIRFLASADPSI
jgi:hypothetical protein